jgi:thiamine biosynthesis lipoprotein
MSAAIVSLLIALALGSNQSTEPVRMSASIGGERVAVEVRDLARQEAERVVRQAFEVIAAHLQSLSRQDPESALSRLNADAGKGPVPIDSDLLLLLQKSIEYCFWSRRAQGPLGGPLYEAWEKAATPPAGTVLKTGSQAAGCSNLQLLPETSQASLSAGSSLDLRHYANGGAVDRVANQFVQAGVTNAWIAIGNVMQAIGPGPSGKGWEYTLPLFAGMTKMLEPVWLRDMALATVSAQRQRFRFGEVSYAAYLDQRTGQPSRGVRGVLVATPNAFDAQVVASAMMILGNREGQLRLGVVDPAPSVLWLLGEEAGEPLITAYKWSALSIR